MKLNWRIRIQQAWSTLLSWRQCMLIGKGIEIRRLFSLEMVLNIHEEIYKSKTISHSKTWKIWKMGDGMVTRSYFVECRQGRSKLSFKNNCAVPRQIKPGILKLIIRRGQSNFITVFIFISCQEKGYHRVVSEACFSFDFRTYWGCGRRMQNVTKNLTLAIFN